MNFNVEEEFKKIPINVKDWNYNLDQVYDVLTVRRNIIIIYKQYLETLVKLEYVLNSDDVKMLVSNINYLGNTLQCMPFGMFGYLNIVVDKCKKYNYDQACMDYPDNYIELLNRVIKIYDKKIEEFEIKKDEYLMLNFSSLAKHFDLNIEDIYNDWVNFSTNSLEENPELKISELHSLFLDYFYFKHSDAIIKALEDGEHNKGLYDVVKNSRLYNKVRG